MSNLTIYNGPNSQQVTLSGLKDSGGTLISTATITGTLTRSGVALTGGTLTFAAVGGTPGSYNANLNGFNSPDGRAELVLTGSNLGNTFKFTVFVTIASRSL
jgi:hypothetical protein